MLIINLSGQKNLGKPHFKAIKKQTNNIVELNLGNSNFDDALAPYLSGFKNLTKLQLQNTAISDKTLERLQKLKYLESLNLYGTQVTEAGLQQLNNIPGLKTLYLWNTDISEKALDTFSNNNPNVSLVRIDRDIFAATSLGPPSITA